VSDRLLRPEERLLVGSYYKFWLPNVRVPSGQVFADALEGKGLEVSGQAVALSAQAITVVCRMLQEQTYLQAASHVAFEVGAATGRGVLVETVVIYQTDGPPGIIQQATEPIRQAAAAAQQLASGVATEAQQTSSTIRTAVSDFTSTIANLSAAAKWIAIGIPVAAAIGAGVYLLSSRKRGRK